MATPSVAAKRKDVRRNATVAAVWWSCVVVAMLSAFGCAHLPRPSAYRADLADNNPSVVRSYLEEALDTLRRVSVHRDSFDWSGLRDSVFARTRQARTTGETWKTLEWALKRVDRHSSLQRPHPATARRHQWSGATPWSAGPPAVLGYSLEERYGYVLVPWFPGEPRASYVDSLQKFIRELDASGVCGWVVDLRGNQGGNMWPMLAGVGPLLGDSVVGYFGMPGRPDMPWRYLNGHSWPGPSAEPDWGARTSLEPVRVRDPLAPTAVLTDQTTGSSGEATVVAFRGRPNVRTFGDTTAGFTSANTGYRLSDGATMIVTVGYNIDRTGYRYPLRIAPDELVQSNSRSAGDAILSRAVGWLRDQPACRRQ